MNLGDEERRLMDLVPALAVRLMKIHPPMLSYLYFHSHFLSLEFLEFLSFCTSSPVTTDRKGKTLRFGRGSGREKERCSGSYCQAVGFLVINSVFLSLMDG